MATQAEPMYINLSADDPDLGTTEIESLCMNCLENVSVYRKYSTNSHVLVVVVFQCPII